MPPDSAGEWNGDIWTEWRYMDGIINVYKEKGYTSHDAVARMRGISGQRRVGHTGTLDPDAEGVLPICLGTATKVCDILTDKSKVYETVLLLGIGTDTEDISGDVTMTGSDRVVALTDEEIVSAINSFVGTYMQLPPMFSAIKCNGQKLCDLARVGKEVERIPRSVDITSIEIVSDIVRGRLSDVTCFEYGTKDDLGDKSDNSDTQTQNSVGKAVLSLKADSMLGRYGEGIDYSSEKGRFRRDSRNEELSGGQYALLPVIRVALRIECSKGTYIRSLCRDIGERLGSYGCIEKLLRTRVGDFRIEDAVRLEEAEQLVREGRFLDVVRPADACFADLKSLHMKAKFDYVLYNGNVMFFRYFSEYIKEPPTPVKVYSSQGEFLAVYEFEERRKLYKPLKMFTTEADQERGGNPEKKTDAQDSPQ